MGDGETIDGRALLGATMLRSPGSLTLPTVEDVQALLPDSAIEFVGDRRELVVYTGWSVHSDGETLVPMDGERD